MWCLREPQLTHIIGALIGWLNVSRQQQIKKKKRQHKSKTTFKRLNGSKGVLRIENEIDF